MRPNLQKLNLPYPIFYFILFIQITTCFQNEISCNLYYNQGIVTASYCPLSNTYNFEFNKLTEVYYVYVKALP